MTDTPRRLMLRATALVVAIIVAAGVFTACSPNRNNAVTRKYQAFITRYNIYYNGDEHYKETLRELETAYQDDYSRRLYLHPIEAKNDAKAPQPTGNFDRSIQKAQKAIQVRSIKKKPKKQAGRNHDEKYKEWMNRTEYNPFLHNAWMMMGRSQYFNGDFSGAAATFLYIERHFKWLPATVTEARLWQVRCYLAEDWLYEAEGILGRVKPDQLINNELRRLYNFDYADWHLRNHRPAEAVPYIEALIKLSKGRTKMRLNFLLGQVYTETGDKSKAYRAFKEAGASSVADYRTQFNARIRQSEVFDGDDIASEVSALRRMTRYDRNKEFLDQIYYAIGNLQLSRCDTLAAIESYRQAVAKSTRSGYDKALANLALGNIYFAQGRYDLAQPCMSEAVPQLPETYPGIAEIKRRSDVLDELAVYAQNVHLQDSLLTLAAMTPEEQMQACKRLADDYKKRKEEEAREADLEARRAQAQANATTAPNTNVAQPMMIGGDDSWYFYNSQAVAAGKQAFQRQWGARKLEDNWRRRNKQQFDFSDFDTDTGDVSADADASGSDAQGDAAPLTEDDKKRLAAAEDPTNPEYYLKDIPRTDAEITQAKDIIQEGMYNMGLILKDKLEDFSAAEAQFERLLREYPDNTYRLEIYYNLYLLYARQGREAEAEKWRRRILDEFADTPLGHALANPDYLTNLRQADAESQRLYEETLSDYFDNRNNLVHANYEVMQQKYPMSKAMPKFMFLEALTYVTEGNPEKFGATLRTLLERYPDTDLTETASAYLKGLAQGQQLQKTSSNMRGMAWSTRLVAVGDSTMTPLDQPLVVEIDPDKPQLLVLLYQTAEVNPALLLYEVARFNFSTFVVRDFDLEQMTFGPLGLLVIKGFHNQRDIDRYRARLGREDAKFVIPPGVRPVVISQDNFDRLLKEGRSFDEYFEAIGEKLDTETHETVLPADQYPPANEMYDQLEQVVKAQGEPIEVLDATPEAAPADYQTPAPTIAPVNDDNEYDIPVPAPPKGRPAISRPDNDIPEGSEGDDD